MISSISSTKSPRKKKTRFLKRTPTALMLLTKNILTAQRPATAPIKVPFQRMM